MDWFFLMMVVPIAAGLGVGLVRAPLEAKRHDHFRRFPARLVWVDMAVKVSEHIFIGLLLAVTIGWVVGIGLVIAWLLL